METINNLSISQNPSFEFYINLGSYLQKKTDEQQINIDEYKNNEELKTLLKKLANKIKESGEYDSLTTGELINFVKENTHTFKNFTLAYNLAVRKTESGNEHNRKEGEKMGAEIATAGQQIKFTMQKDLDALGDNHTAATTQQTSKILLSTMQEGVKPFQTPFTVAHNLAKTLSENRQEYVQQSEDADGLPLEGEEEPRVSENMAKKIQGGGGIESLGKPKGKGKKRGKRRR